jgi:hypothetical protein
MRRELVRVSIPLVLCGALAGCPQSGEERARHATERAREESAVRQTPTVERVTTPTDSGRILYDAPPDLSAASPGRPGVAINGADTSSRKPDSTPTATSQKAPPAT